MPTYFGKENIAIQAKRGSADFIYAHIIGIMHFLDVQVEESHHGQMINGEAYADPMHSTRSLPDSFPKIIGTENEARDVEKVLQYTSDVVAYLLKEQGRENAVENALLYPDEHALEYRAVLDKLSLRQLFAIADEDDLREFERYIPLDLFEDIDTLPNSPERYTAWINSLTPMELLQAYKDHKPSFVRCVIAAEDELNMSQEDEGFGEQFEKYVQLNEAIIGKDVQLHLLLSEKISRTFLHGQPGDILVGKVSQEELDIERHG